MRWISYLEGGPKRVNHAAVSVGHKIYSFGGYCTGENSRDYTSIDVHVLNTTTLRWTQHPVSDLPYFENDDILPYKRYGHTAVAYRDSVYIWGGRNDRGSCAALFRFDALWHCWRAAPTSGNAPSPRDGHASCLWRHLMLVHGGYEEEADAFSGSVYALDLRTMHWSYVHVNGREPTLRDFHTTVVIGDRMYMFGGRGTSNNPMFATTGRPQEYYCNELWYLDLLSFTWHRCRTTGDKPIGRRSHSAFVYESKMYIFGGYNSVREQHFNDMYEFDTETNVWKRLNIPGKKPCERRRQVCVVVGDRVFLFGGTSPQPSDSIDGDNRDVDDKLIDHSDMYVLDFKPSLKTLCILAVRKYKLDESMLPHNLKLDIMNLYTPNKITVNRPNNSAG